MVFCHDKQSEDTHSLPSNNFIRLDCIVPLYSHCLEKPLKLPTPGCNQTLPLLFLNQELTEENYTHILLILSCKCICLFMNKCFRHGEWSRELATIQKSSLNPLPVFISLFLIIMVSFAYFQLYLNGIIKIYYFATGFFCIVLCL